MDKINIVSSQAVLEMSSFSMDTRSMSSSPLVNSLVKNRLFKTAPDIDEPPFHFIHTMNLSVVDTMLHDSPDLVIYRIETCADSAVWRPHVGRKKVWRFLTQQFNCCTCAVQCACALSSWNTKLLPGTLCIAGSSMTSLWRREAASKKLVRDITKTFLFCNSSEITACIADLFNSFCEEVHVVAFFKVVQQQTIGEVGNFNYMFVGR